MKKNKNILLILLALSSLAFISSCKSKNKIPVEIDYFLLGYTSATVVNYQVDGCVWMLQLEDPDKNGTGEKKYEPQNLSEEFKKDQLKVWVKYEIQKDAVSICMAGTVIKIVDMVERK